MHYILPFLIYYFIKKEKVMLYGLLAGNLIDLDHIYLKIIGKVGWFESACSNGLGSQCSFGIYPLHNLTSAVILIIASIILFKQKNKNFKLNFVFWLLIGAILNLVLDYIHLVTRFAI